MKKLLLSTCLLTGLIATPYLSGAYAQNAKPGQRLIQDSRMSQEPSQLDKPVFTRDPQQVINQQSTPQAETATPEAQQEPAPDAQTQQDLTDAVNDAQDAADAAEDAAEQAEDAADENTPSIYMRGNSNGNVTTLDELSGNTEMENRNPDSFEDRYDTSKSGEIERRLENFDRNMPYKDLSNSDFAKLPAEEQQKVLNARKAYTDQHKADIIEEARKDNE